MSTESTTGEASLLSDVPAEAVAAAQEPEVMEEDLPQHVVDAVQEAIKDASIDAVEPEDAPVEMNAGTFQNLYTALQGRELDNGGLIVEEYVELFLMEAVQNFDYARQTLARAKLQHPKESLFITLQGLLCFNYSQDFATALKKIKAAKKRLMKYQRYVDELHNRILAYGVASVAESYSMVKSRSLGYMFGFSSEDAEMAAFLGRLNWPLENGIVRVSKNPEVTAFINEHVSHTYGPFYGMERFWNLSQLGRKHTPLDNLKQLMMVSDTLSKVILPPSETTAKNGSNGSNENEGSEENQPHGSAFSGAV